MDDEELGSNFADNSGVKFAPAGEALSCPAIHIAATAGSDITDEVDRALVTEGITALAQNRHSDHDVRTACSGFSGCHCSRGKLYIFAYVQVSADRDVERVCEPFKDIKGDGKLNAEEVQCKNDGNHLGEDSQEIEGFGSKSLSERRHSNKGSLSWAQRLKCLKVDGETKGNDHEGSLSGTWEEASECTGDGSKAAVSFSEMMKPCKFFARGRCKRGSWCSFSHEGSSWASCRTAGPPGIDSLAAEEKADLQIVITRAETSTVGELLQCYASLVKLEGVSDDAAMRANNRKHLILLLRLLEGMPAAELSTTSEILVKLRV